MANEEDRTKWIHVNQQHLNVVNKLIDICVTHNRTLDDTQIAVSVDSQNTRNYNYIINTSSTTTATDADKGSPQPVKRTTDSNKRQHVSGKKYKSNKEQLKTKAVDNLDVRNKINRTTLIKDVNHSKGNESELNMSSTPVNQCVTDQSSVHVEMSESSTIHEVHGAGDGNSDNKIKNKTTKKKDLHNTKLKTKKITKNFSKPESLKEKKLNSEKILNDILGKGKMATFNRSFNRKLKKDKIIVDKNEVGRFSKCAAKHLQPIPECGSTSSTESDQIGDVQKPRSTSFTEAKTVVQKLSSTSFTEEKKVVQKQCSTSFTAKNVVHTLSSTSFTDTKKGKKSGSKKLKMKKDSCDEQLTDSSSSTNIYSSNEMYKDLGMQITIANDVVDLTEQEGTINVETVCESPDNNMDILDDNMQTNFELDTNTDDIRKVEGNRNVLYVKRVCESEFKVPRNKDDTNNVNPASYSIPKVDKISSKYAVVGSNNGNKMSNLEEARHQRRKLLDALGCGISVDYVQLSESDADSDSDLSDMFTNSADSTMFTSTPMKQQYSNDESNDDASSYSTIISELSDFSDGTILQRNNKSHDVSICKISDHHNGNILIHNDNKSDKALLTTNTSCLSTQIANNDPEMVELPDVSEATGYNLNLPQKLPPCDTSKTCESGGHGDISQRRNMSPKIPTQNLPLQSSSKIHGTKSDQTLQAFSKTTDTYHTKLSNCAMSTDIRGSNVKTNASNVLSDVSSGVQQEHGSKFNNVDINPSKSTSRHNGRCILRDSPDNVLNLVVQLRKKTVVNSDELKSSEERKSQDRNEIMDSSISKLSENLLYKTRNWSPPDFDDFVPDYDECSTSEAEINFRNNNFLSFMDEEQRVGDKSFVKSRSNSGETGYVGNGVIGTNICGYDTTDSITEEIDVNGNNDPNGLEKESDVLTADIDGVISDIDDHTFRQVKSIMDGMHNKITSNSTHDTAITAVPRVTSKSRNEDYNGNKPLDTELPGVMSEIINNDIPVTSALGEATEATTELDNLPKCNKFWNDIESSVTTADFWSNIQNAISTISKGTSEVKITDEIPKLRVSFTEDSNKRHVGVENINHCDGNSQTSTDVHTIHSEHNDGTLNDHTTTRIIILNNQQQNGQLQNTLNEQHSNVYTPGTGNCKSVTSNSTNICKLATTHETKIASRRLSTSHKITDQVDRRVFTDDTRWVFADEAIRRKDKLLDRRECEMDAIVDSPDGCGQARNVVSSQSTSKDSISDTHVANLNPENMDINSQNSEPSLHGVHPVNTTDHDKRNISLGYAPIFTSDIHDIGIPSNANSDAVKLLQDFNMHEPILKATESVSIPALESVSRPSSASSSSLEKVSSPLLGPVLKPAQLSFLRQTNTNTSTTFQPQPSLLKLSKNSLDNFDETLWMNKENRDPLLHVKNSAPDPRLESLSKRIKLSHDVSTTVDAAITTHSDEHIKNISPQDARNCVPIFTDDAQDQEDAVTPVKDDVHIPNFNDSETPTPLKDDVPMPTYERVPTPNFDGPITVYNNVPTTGYGGAQAPILNNVSTSAFDNISTMVPRHDSNPTPMYGCVPTSTFSNVPEVYNNVPNPMPSPAYHTPNPECDNDPTPVFEDDVLFLHASSDDTLLNESSDESSEPKQRVKRTDKPVLSPIRFTSKGNVPPRVTTKETAAPKARKSRFSSPVQDGQGTQNTPCLDKQQNLSGILNACPASVFNPPNTTPHGYCPNYLLQRCHDRLCKLKHQPVPRSVGFTHTVQTLKTHIASSHFERSMVLYNSLKLIQHQDAPADVLYALSMLSVQTENIDSLFVLLNDVYKAAILDVKLCNGVLRLCDASCVNHVQPLCVLFDVVSNQQLAPDADAFLVFLKTFSHVGAWHMTWRAVCHTSLCKGMRLPPFILNQLVWITVQQPNQLLGFAAHWLTKASSMDVEVIDRPNLNQLCTMLFNQGFNVSGQVIVDVLNPKDPVHAPSMNYESEVEFGPTPHQYYSSDEATSMENLKAYIHRIKCCEITKNMSYLGEIFVEMSCKEQRFDVCLVDAYVSALLVPGRLDVMMDNFNAFMSVVIPGCVTAFQRDSTIRLDKRLLSEIAYRLILQCHREENWVAGYAVIRPFVTEKIPLKPDGYGVGELSRVITEVCVGAGEMVTAETVIEDCNWAVLAIPDSANLHDIAECVRYVTVLLRQCSAMRHYGLATKVLTHIIDGPSRNIYQTAIGCDGGDLRLVGERHTIDPDPDDMTSIHLI